MKKFIHHLRRQSEKNKRHILHIAIIVCGVILVILWIYSLGMTLSNPDTQTKMSQDLKPLSVIKDNMVSGYQNITN